MNPLSEGDYGGRIPVGKFQDWKRVEEECLGLNELGVKGISGVVVGHGCVYGNGEEDEGGFYDIWERSWKSNAEELGNNSAGRDERNDRLNNSLPTVHVDDLVATVKAAVGDHQAPRYVLACDRKQSTIREIVDAVSNEISKNRSGGVASGTTDAENGGTQTETTDSEDGTNISLLKLNLCIDSTGSWSSSLPLKYADAGLVGSIGDVGRQFVDRRGLRPVKICLGGPPGTGKVNARLAKRLSDKYRVPIVDGKRSVEWLYRQWLYQQKMKESEKRKEGAEEGEGEGKDESEGKEEKEEQEGTEANVASPPDLLMDELASIYSSASGDTEEASLVPWDSSALSPSLVRQCLQRRIGSSRCLVHGYVLLDSIVSEEDANVVFSDPDPPKVLTEEEEEEKRKKEEEEKKGKKDDKKGKKDDKKGKKGEEAEEEYVVCAPREVNKSRLPDLVISREGSDDRLMEDMGFKTTEEAPEMTEEGEKFKSELKEYRQHLENFGWRPKKESKEEDKEESKDDSKTDEPDGEPAPALEIQLPSSLSSWIEAHNPSLKSLQLPSDDVAAENLSVAYIGTMDGMMSSCNSLIEDGVGGEPGICWVMEDVDMENWEEEESIEDVEEAPKASGDDLTPAGNSGEQEPPANATEGSSSSCGGQLPHEKIFNSLNMADINQIEEMNLLLEDYSVNNIMKDVTKGMMSVLSQNPDDPVEFLADYLIEKGKEYERNGREEAKDNFDQLLKHVDDLSSRLFDARTETSTFATGFSSGAKS